MIETYYSALQVKTYTFENFLKEKGFIVYTNVGTSMLPLLRERRDIIEICLLTRSPRKYDVILYKRGETYILHRVLKVLPNGKGYLIAGDHNTLIERDVVDEMILGRMTRIVRDGKEINVDVDWKYKLYSHIWVDFFTIRSLILRVKRKTRRINQRFLHQ